MATFKKNTRYTNGQLSTNRAGQSFIVLRKPLNLEQGEEDTFVTINQELLQRPDLLSYRAYNIPDLWWVIFEYNKVSDPLFGLRLGQTLRIPSLTRVLKAIELMGLN